MHIKRANKPVNILLCLFFILVISPAVASIGISSIPYPKLYFFEPNMELVLNMKCFEYTDDCEPYVTGEFSEYAVISDFREAGQNEKSFKVTIKMPAEIKTPGKHELYIGVTDIEKRVSAGISVITKVRKVVNFMVLYETKYAKVSFSAPNINENETAMFMFEVSNFGKPELMLVYGKVDIFNNMGQKVGSTQSKSTIIKSTKTKSLSAEWDSYGAVPGEYAAVGTLLYDGNKKVINQTFLIGTKDIKILDYTRNFEAGKISRMDIDVRNKWNGPINEMYAAVKILEKEFKTPTVLLNAFQSNTLTGYLDTTNIEPGIYPAEIIVYFDGNQKKEDGKINITAKEEIRLPIKIGFNPTTILILSVVALIILAIINIIVTLRERKKKS